MSDLVRLDESRERAHAAREALVGKTIAGRYVLRGLLGHGGMGAVYEAEHLGLGKRAAVKFVDPEFATDDKVVARFAREARAMSAIESAHIVTVFDAGTEDGRPYLVMELLRGEDLGQRLRRMRRIPLGEAMHVVAQVLKGLARAHAAGIVHRDLKPDNVFLVKHDTDPLFAKIVDFGISKIERPRANTHPLALTGRGTVLGTPFYMSPEQAQASSDVDGRSDLYSVGAILFECLTGRPPHTGESYEQIILSICMRDAPSVSAIEPSIADNVSAFVARALARDREQRFTSAERMLAALHEVAPQERTRVPLDPVAPETLLSAGVNPLGMTVLDGGAPQSRPGSRPSWPEDSKLTRLGMGSLDANADMKLHGEANGNAKANADGDASADADPKALATPIAVARDGERSAPVAVAKRASSPERVSGAKSGKRPVGMALATAAFATLTGVGVTFGIIQLLDKKADVTPAPVRSAITAPPSASTAAPAAPSALAAPATSAAESVPSGAPSSSAAPASPDAAADRSGAKPATGSAVRPAGKPKESGALPVLPRPSTKPLDIQRDLP